MIDKLIEQIIENPLFLRLKKVVENNPWHDHEAVYDHLIKTKDIAKRELSGDFITNPEAKILFLQFVNEEVGGMKRADIMVLIALIHDIGKVLTVNDNSGSHPILVTNPPGITSCPGHEYWGSIIVREFLEGLSLQTEILQYIATIIELHDTFNDGYLGSKKDLPMDLVINDIKSRAKGFYKEALFNIYCDVNTALPSVENLKMIEKIFSDASLYGKREYVIT